MNGLVVSMLIKCLQLLKGVGAIKQGEVNCYGCCDLTKILGKLHMYVKYTCTQNPLFCNGLHSILLPSLQPRKWYYVMDIKTVNLLFVFALFLFPVWKVKMMVYIVLNECLEIRFIHVIKFAQNIQYYTLYRSIDFMHQMWREQELWPPQVVPKWSPVVPKWSPNTQGDSRRMI